MNDDELIKAHVCWAKSVREEYGLSLRKALDMAVAYTDSCAQPSDEGYAAFVKENIRGALREDFDNGLKGLFSLAAEEGSESFWTAVALRDHCRRLFSAAISIA